MHEMENEQDVFEVSDDLADPESAASQNGADAPIGAAGLSFLEAAEEPDETADADQLI